MRGAHDLLAQVDPNQPSFNGATLRDQVHERTVGLRLLAGLMSALGVLALLLAIVGTYALMVNTVAHRRNEFGIRMALGASATDILILTVGLGARLIAGGVALGLIAAFAMGHVVENAFSGLLTSDPGLVGGIGALLGAVALVAAILPARRATRLDPSTVLRE